MLRQGDCGTAVVKFMLNPKNKCLKVAITGGMGCGKSAAVQVLKDMGVEVLDADKLCHKALEVDCNVQTAVKSLLGEDSYDKTTGFPRRDVIAKKVFSNSVLLEGLEKILHPAIEKMWEEKAEEIAKKENGADCGIPIVAVEVPLLYEKSLEKKFDVCICVYCSNELRIKRLENRGMALEQIASRDAFQIPSEIKAAKADIVLFNETDFEFLQKQTALVLYRLKKYGR